MRKTTLLAALAVASAMPAVSQAAYYSSVSLSGGFSVTGFSVNPTLDTDANPYTYTIELTDLVGMADIDVPAAGETVTWTTSGYFGANAGGMSIIPTTSWTNETIVADDHGTLAAGEYSFNFINQTYIVTSGASSIEFGPFDVLGFDVLSTLGMDYQITALDADGILNDVVFNVIETPAAGFYNLSAALNIFDTLPTSGQPGTIDGTFNLYASAEGESAVMEPASLGLLGLGLAGIAGLRRRKA
ncbi:MAG TPA: hypothetical protein DDW29_10780 [Gammaproteobacteria bacterium]|nr:hypothetical protein [Gammaproteobacteria bacterium]